MNDEKLFSTISSRDTKASTLDAGSREEVAGAAGRMPCVLEPSGSTYLRSGGFADIELGSAPYSADGELLLGREGSAMRVLLKFDLSGLEFDRVASAELSLTAKSGVNGGAFFSELFEYGFEFGEVSSTWNRPGKADPTPGGTLIGGAISAVKTDLPLGGSLSFENTPTFVSAVNAALSFPDKTLRLLIVKPNDDTGGSQFIRLYSGNADNRNNRPKLTLVPGGTDGLAPSDFDFGEDGLISVDTRSGEIVIPDVTNLDSGGGDVSVRFTSGEGSRTEVKIELIDVDEIPSVGDLPAGAAGTVTSESVSSELPMGYDALEAMDVGESVMPVPQAPQPKISGPGAVWAGKTVNVVVDFGEAVFGFDQSGLLVQNGSVEELVETGVGVFSVTLAAGEQTPLSVAVPANVTASKNGNQSNLAAGELLIEVKEPPTGIARVFHDLRGLGGQFAEAGQTESVSLFIGVGNGIFCHDGELCEPGRSELRAPFVAGNTGETGATVQIAYRDQAGHLVIGTVTADKEGNFAGMVENSSSVTVIVENSSEMGGSKRATIPGSKVPDKDSAGSLGEGEIKGQYYKVVVESVWP